MAAISRSEESLTGKDYVFPMIKNIVGDIVIDVDLSIAIPIVGNQMAIDAMETLLGREIPANPTVANLLPAFIEMSESDFIAQGFIREESPI